MSRFRFALVLMCLCASAALAQVEVPVSYQLGSGSPLIDGALIGGSICEPDGLSLLEGQATVPRVIDYESIDRVETMNLGSDDKLQMQVVLKDDTRFEGFAKISGEDPILILRDEVASDTATASAKVRTFTKANFKGISALNFEAEVTVEMDIEEFKTLTADLVKAVEADDLEKAIDIHNRLGDFLEGLSEGDDQGPTGQPPNESTVPGAK